MTEQEKNDFNKKASLVVLDKNCSFVASNSLIEARYNLTKIEQKVMIAVITRINFTDTDFYKCKVDIQGIGQYCGFSPNHAFEYLDKVTDGLMEKVIRFYDRDGNIKYKSHWLQSCFINREEGYFLFELDKSLKADLLKLRKAFLKEDKPYKLMNFDSIYSIRIYLLLKQYIKIGHRSFTPEWFLIHFELPKSYNIFNRLKIKVIEKAVSEINNISDLIVDVEYIRANKRGQKVTRIDFSIRSKTKAELEKYNISEDFLSNEAVEVIPELPQPSTEEKLEEAGQGVSILPDGTVPDEPVYKNMPADVLATEQEQAPAAVAKKHPAQPQEIEPMKPKQSSVDLSSFSDIEKEVIERMIYKYGLAPKFALGYMKGSGLDYCQKNMEYVRNQSKSGNVRNKGGLLKDALENDYAGLYLMEQEAIAREEKAKADNKLWDKQAKEFFAGHPELEEPKETEHDLWVRKKIQFTIAAVREAFARNEDIVKAKELAEKIFIEKYPEPKE